MMRTTRMKAMHLRLTPREAMHLLDRLSHVDKMSVDDTNALLTLLGKMKSLVIQQKRQTYIGDFFRKN